MDTQLQTRQKATEKDHCLDIAYNMIELVFKRIHIPYETHRLNLLSSPVSDEEGLASPLEGHVLALWDVSKLHLNLGQGQHILRRTPGHDKVADKGLGSVGTSQPKSTSHDIAEYAK